MMSDMTIRLIDMPRDIDAPFYDAATICRHAAMPKERVYLLFVARMRSEMAPPLAGLSDVARG